MAGVLDAFTAEGRWYRGNLHLHTTHSDGRLSPAEAVQMYRRRGYDFLAITDHWHLTDPDELEAGDDFLLVPGEEINGYHEPADMIWHAVGLFPEREVPRTVDQPPQWGIDALREVGADAVLAHPYWSGNQVDEILALEGLFAIEIYNTTCQRGPGRGHSLVHWDGLWHAERRLWGLAVDDAHRPPYDGLQGWIILKAPALTLQAVREALRAGHFYSTTGPEIKHLAIEDGHVSVRCSPCEAIRAQSNRWMGRSAYADAEFGGPGHPLTEARLPIIDEAAYVRVTCTDAAGHSAWSNPITLA